MTSETPHMMGSSDVEEGVGLKDKAMSTKAPSNERPNLVGPSSASGRAMHRSKALRNMPGVVLHVFQISTDGKVTPQGDKPFDGLADGFSSGIISDDETTYWVHVDADERSRADLNEWIDQLHMGNFISEQIKRPAEDWMSHVLSTKLKALIIIRILPAVDRDGSYLANQAEYLAAVMKDKLLLTYTTNQSGSKNELSHESMAYMTQDEILDEGSVSSAILSWLEFHVLRTRMAITALRKKAVVLVKQLDLDPNSVSLEAILHVRDNVLVILSVAEEQSQCLGMVKSMDQDTDSVDFTQSLEGALGVLVATAESNEQMGNRVEKLVKNLKDNHDAIQQGRINKRLAVLTVVSAIFMPLTFLAGVYGMNFSNMPELEYENSYFILMGSMLAIAVSMMWYFYANGWFD